MKFDPTFDYGFSDLNQEENLVYWKFGELIKTLITLSSSADRQREIIGVGWITEEMVVDFDMNFTIHLSQYLDHNLLKTSVADKLSFLDKFFNQRSTEEYPDFWNDKTLDENCDWVEVRAQATEILTDLGFEDLDIAFERPQRFETSQDGKQLLIEITRTVLKRINVE